MERLTFDGNFCDIAQCDVIPGGSYCKSGSCTQRKVWERLKAYEDTRRTPEEVDKLTKDWTDLCTIVGECGGISRVRELADADKDGRLVVLPCKVGDTMRLIDADPQGIKEKVAMDFEKYGGVRVVKVERVDEYQQMTMEGD